MSRIPILAVLFILVSASIPLFQAETFQENQRRTWYVGSHNTEGPWDGSLVYPFFTIQTAIDHAGPNDTIMVFNGIYHENIVIDKPLAIKNSILHEPIIDGSYNQTIVSIQHPNVVFEGFIIRNSSGMKNSCAIKCNANNTIISDCQIYRTRSGIRIKNTKFNTITDCFFHTNGEGIAAINSDQLTIQSNDFTHNSLGINSDLSSNLTIKDCYATVNGIGIFLNNSENVFITDTASFNNNDNQGGIFLNDCEQIQIKNSRIEHNGFGIKPFNCEDINIEGSTSQHNTHVGIFADRTIGLSINNCLFNKNFRYSINTFNSIVSIHQSNFISSLVGLYAEDSTIDATSNYWGSSFGPVFFEHPRVDRVRVKSTDLSIYPVSNNPFPSGASWNISDGRCKIPSDLWLHPVIFNPGLDSDGDGATDSWEKAYGYDSTVWNNHEQLDPDEDGLSNIEECYTYQWNSDPFQKDIFLEIDWMSSQTGDPDQNKLTTEDIQVMKDVFLENNIILHVDHGDLDGGEEVEYQRNFSYADLRDIYWDNFLDNDLNNPRKGIFHYCIINDWGPGPGFAFMGWDGLDSFDISAQALTENQPSIDRNVLITGGGIHELGHTLGLTVDDHPGNDNQIATWIFSKQWWKYRQYKSCMNYWYTYRIFGFSDGSNGPYDFNDWDHMDLSFFKNTHFDLPDHLS